MRTINPWFLSSQSSWFLFFCMSPLIHISPSLSYCSIHLDYSSRNRYNLRTCALSPLAWNPVTMFLKELAETMCTRPLIIYFITQWLECKPSGRLSSTPPSPVMLRNSLISSASYSFFTSHILSLCPWALPPKKLNEVLRVTHVPDDKI